MATGSEVAIRRFTPRCHLGGLIGGDHFEVGDGVAVPTLALYRRVVPTWDLPEEGLRAGDVGVIVEHYPARTDAPEGYELEVFAATGQTIAVVSVPADAIREATEHEVLSVHELARA